MDNGTKVFYRKETPSYPLKDWWGFPVVNEKNGMSTSKLGDTRDKSSQH